MLQQWDDNERTVKERQAAVINFRHLGKEEAGRR
jgi:hypothetical protein